MSALWLCEHRHNYCVYKAELLLLLNYWGGVLREEELGGGGVNICRSLSQLWLTRLRNALCSFYNYRVRG